MKDPFTNHLPTSWDIQVGGGGFKHFFGIFTPKPGEMIDPMLTSIFFKWVGEKPPTRKNALHP